MAGWQIRHEGSPHIVQLPSATRVLEGIRDGEWEPTDEVRGSNDRQWQSIEDHPLFAETMAELEPPLIEKPDETRLDMNPLIDVALVLLIFFILTATYSSLRRSLDLPPIQSEDGPSAAKMVQPDDIKDRVIKIKVIMDKNQEPIVTLEGKTILIDEINQKLAEEVGSKRRNELYMDVAKDVPWGIEAKIHDAAKACKITQIYWPSNE